MSRAPNPAIACSSNTARQRGGNSASTFQTQSRSAMLVAISSWRIVGGSESGSDQEPASFDPASGSTR